MWTSDQEPSPGDVTWRGTKTQLVVLSVRVTPKTEILAETEYFARQGNLQTRPDSKGIMCMWHECE